ncbi:MAG: hypothetical protein P8Y01_07265 [Woeseiaceae bacterium]
MISATSATGNDCGAQQFALITAFLVSTPRFITYAAILAIAGIGGAWYGLEPGYILVLASVPMLVLAVSVVVRFVRSNPVS